MLIIGNENFLKCFFKILFILILLLNKILKQVTNMTTTNKTKDKFEKTIHNYPSFTTTYIIHLSIVSINKNSTGPYYQSKIS